MRLAATVDEELGTNVDIDLEVLDGENMVGCRRCWKIANGVYKQPKTGEEPQEGEDADDTDSAEGASPTAPDDAMRDLAETLRSPFKFIVFLDDLSFSREDDNFAALKAFIEGGLAGKPANLVIYATSNRRHLIRESFADR